MESLSSSTEEAAAVADLQLQKQNFSSEFLRWLPSAVSKNVHKMFSCRGIYLLMKQHHTLPPLLLTAADAAAAGGDEDVKVAEAEIGESFWLKKFFLFFSPSLS